MTPGEAREKLWRAGSLLYKFHPGQEVIEIAYRKVVGKLFIANCARRFGKTFWAACKCIEKALTTPQGRIKIATAFQKDLEEFILPAFELALQDCPEDIAPKFKATKKKYFFKNGAEIQLIGLDKNPNAGRGNYCDLYVFEEAGFIKKLDYIYSSVVIPMTMYRQGAKVVMISTPPVTPAHPFQGFCQRAENQTAYVKLTIHHNPMATPEIIAEYKAECLSETDWQREYLCEFVTDEKLVVVPEWRDTFIKETPRDEFYYFYHKYEAMDVGARDNTATLFGYYDFRRAKLVIEDEDIVSGPTMTTEILVNRIKAKEVERWEQHKPYRRIADNNNLILLQDLSIMHGLHFAPTNKDTLIAMVNELRMFVGAGRMEVHPRCANLIGCLKYGIFKDEKRDEFARMPIYGHFDALASLIYLVRNLDQHTNPIPHDYGFDPRVSVIKTKPLNKSQQTIKELFRPKF